jgi:hypothetical protein
LLVLAGFAAPVALTGFAGGLAVAVEAFGEGSGVVVVLARTAGRLSESSRRDFRSLAITHHPMSK